MATTMKMAAVLMMMAFIALASAQTQVYKFKNNNDWSNKNNWVGGNIPTGTVDLSQGCIEKFGEGGATLFLDQSATVGELILPSNGQIKLGNEVEIKLSGNTDDNNGKWRCKSDIEMHTACSDNFLRRNPRTQEYEQADTAPCYNDIIQFPEDSAISVLWSAGQFIRMVEPIDENNRSTSIIRNTRDLQAYDNAYPNTFQGPVPMLGEVSSCGGDILCQAKCVDICPEADLSAAREGGARDEFFELDLETRDKIIQDTVTDRDTLNSIRFDATNDFKDSPGRLTNVADEMQEEYKKSMEADGFELKQATGRVVIPELLVTAANMANWMESARTADTHAVHYIRHSLTKSNAEKTLTFFDDVKSGRKFYDTGAVMDLDDELWTAIDAKGPTSTNSRFRRATYRNLADFMLKDTNQLLASHGGDGADGLRIEDFTNIVASAADPSLDFDWAAGGFTLSNIELKASGSSLMQYVHPTTGETKPSVSPTVLQGVLSATLSRMAMFSRAEFLRDVILNKPTTTLSPTTSPTVSPTMSPTVSPTVSPTTSMPTAAPTLSPTAAEEVDALAENLIPIAAGGGGGFLLLLIIIILIIIILKGGNKDNKEDEKRNVVAFENPMYDDPAMNGGARPEPQQENQQVDLYDEPTFNNPDKQNPMYASNDDFDNKGGDGYLDVQPDDEDEDEESSSDDDE